jgi:hypothetical protein
VLIVKTSGFTGAYVRDRTNDRQRVRGRNPHVNAQTRLYP